MSADDDDRRSSWWPVDLGPVVAGERVVEPATILTRTDGSGLWYPGKVHSVASEPEAGKSWTGTLATSQQLAVGRHVVLLDFEDGPETAVERLRLLGTDPDAILERFHWVGPQETLDAEARVALDHVLDLDPSLVILDGVTELLALLGLDLMSNTDWAEAMEALVRPIVRAGPATTLFDHVTKSRDSKNRWALGAGHKLASVDVALTMDRVQPFGRGRIGRSRIAVAKDRPGHLRAMTRGGSDLVGELVLDSTGDGTRAWIEAPTSSPGPSRRPTRLMEAVSRVLEEVGDEGLSGNRIELQVRGNAQDIRTAVSHLLADGYVEVVGGPRQAKLHRSVRPFRDEVAE